MLAHPAVFVTHRVYVSGCSEAGGDAARAGVRIRLNPRHDARALVADRGRRVTSELAECRPLPLTTPDFEGVRLDAQHRRSLLVREQVVQFNHRGHSRFSRQD